jgi:hypothetical protein
MDLINVFDNEKVVGRSYVIKPANKVKLSIITNKAVLHLLTTNLQNELLLKPRVQFFNLSHLSLLDLGLSKNAETYER